MNINNHLKSSSPAIVRLKSEHKLLSTELNQLNRELLALKNIIRHKQKNLRTVNIALIQKAIHKPYLSIVRSTSTNQAPEILNHQAETPLVCIQGGKHS